ncbi:MAG: PD-(D/E)XK nuclease family protein [Methanomassiliicoccaceae archaeon]|nr:PD-(D/E)XK nuclease family protein [Methanomassiliicoccaceae archaeon]
MKLAKTIDELYEEVKGYDIVISTDAALVTALNNRIGTPRIGRLASTPMMIAKDHEDAILEGLMGSGVCAASGMFGIMDDVKLLETISELTGYDIRFVHGEVENIRTIRKHTKEVGKHIFGRPSKRIYEEFEQLPTYEMVMSSFDPVEHHAYDGKRVAVIAIELFSDLDKHFIPSDFDEIDIFKDGRYDMDTVYAVGNDRQVAEHAADLISAANAEDVAIVMDTTGPIADAVRSALYRKKIGFKNVLSARDIIDVRDYMDFIIKSLSYDILTVGDVRELYASYGAWMDSRYDEYLLSRHTAGSGERLRQLSDVMRDIRGHTFADVCEKVVSRSYRGTVRMVLDGLGLSDRIIDDNSVSNASYLINSMDDIKHNAQIPDNERNGVLLADCRNSVFIDRPLMMYLNMDGAWSGTVIGKNYMDAADEREKDLIRFQALLQQGSSRVYIVNTMKDGKAARPCSLFDALNRDGTILRRVDTFSDIVNTQVAKGAWCPPRPTDDIRVRRPAEGAGELRKFSNSTIKMYIACPMAYMFGELVGSPDSENTVFGNLIHEFAEFYLCHPEVAREGIDRCITMISDVYAGISCPEKSDLDISRIRVAVSNVSDFIDHLNVDVQLADITTDDRINRFSEAFGMRKRAENAEMDHFSPGLPLHGKFDLVHGSMIADYKTGRPLSVREIAERMDVTKRMDYYEPQPFVYLSILDDILGPHGRKEFVQFYAMDNDADAAGDPDFNVMRNARIIIVMDREEIVRQNIVRDVVSAKRGYDFVNVMGNGFTQALTEAGAGNAENWPNDDELFHKLMSMHHEKGAKGRERIKKTIEHAKEVMMRCYIVMDEKNKIIIPRGSLDRFKDYSKRLYSRANEQQVSGFPYAPRKGCERCGFEQICTGGPADDETE